MKINSVKPGVPKKATYLSLIAVVLFLAWLNYAVGYNHMPVKGTMVQLMNRTGGSAAFGAWASNRIKGRAGAQCEHLNHVTTQLPYALTAASVSFFTFLVAGFTKSALLSLIFGMVALFLLLLFIRHRRDK